MHRYWGYLYLSVHVGLYQQVYHFTGMELRRDLLSHFLYQLHKQALIQCWLHIRCLDLPFAIIRPIIALVYRYCRRISYQPDRQDRKALKQEEDKGNSLPKGFFPRLKEMFRYAFVEFLQDISGWLVAGLAIAALISVIIPDNFFAGVVSNDLVEMLIILLQPYLFISVPRPQFPLLPYLC